MATFSGERQDKRCLKKSNETKNLSSSFLKGYTWARLVSHIIVMLSRVNKKIKHSKRKRKAQDM